MSYRPAFSPFWLGVGIGTAYTALLLPTLALQPLARPAGGPAIPVLALVTAYLAGGVLMGVVLHVLWPRVSTARDAVAAGMAAAMPFFFSVRLAVLGFGGWDPAHVAGLALRIAAGGALAGFLLWQIQRRRQPN